MRKLLLILLALALCGPSFAITKTPHLVAYFPLMGDALDHSGAGITTTVSGAVPAAGKIGGAYDFPGGGTINSTGFNATAINTANRLTVALWVNVRGTAGADRPLYFGAGGPNYISLFGGGWVFVVATSGAAQRVLTTSADAGLWVHLAGTWDGTTLSLYKNGVLAASGSFPGDVLQLTGDVRFGPGGSFNGLIQHVAIYNTALSQQDIKRVMLGLNPING